MFALLHSLAMFVIDFFKSPRRLEAENLFLRHQLSIALRRAPPRLRLRGSDRATDRSRLDRRGKIRMWSLIGTVRRECLDRVLIFGEAHLRQILSSYAAYYNKVRTHLALGKDAPLGRAVQRTGVIVAIPILSGRHHHYVRI